MFGDDFTHSDAKASYNLLEAIEQSINNFPVLRNSGFELKISTANEYFRAVKEDADKRAKSVSGKWVNSETGFKWPVYKGDYFSYSR